MPLAPYQERVIVEHEQLRTKRRTLELFLDGMACRELIDPEERAIMIQQVSAMAHYEHLLELRINRFK